MYGTVYDTHLLKGIDSVHVNGMGLVLTRLVFSPICTDATNNNQSRLLYIQINSNLPNYIIKKV